MCTLKKLLAQVKELNVPRRNVMSRKDLQKVIKDTIIKYKEIFVGVDSPICVECLNELRQKQVIGEMAYQKKACGEYRKEA